MMMDIAAVPTLAPPPPMPTIEAKAAAAWVVAAVGPPSHSGNRHKPPWLGTALSSTTSLV
jgi:hypothetical protein